MPRSIRPAFAGVIFPAACTSLVIMTAADAPPWSIGNLRISEAPAASATK